VIPARDSSADAMKCLSRNLIWRKARNLETSFQKARRNRRQTAILGTVVLNGLAASMRSFR